MKQKEKLYHFVNDEWYYLGEMKGEAYNAFLKFAFSYSDYFGLSTFKSVRKKDLHTSYHDLLEKIAPYEVDPYKFKRLPQHYERGQKIHVYILNDYTRKVIADMKVEGIYSWIIPSLPDDLSFFKGKRVWFNSITHAKISKVWKEDSKALEAISQIVSIYR